jgi:predicted 3-demethylubiquinone-9 3-methyltransferase (glyoxalase superfamily)
MTRKITPCLWYNAQAKEAASLYCAAFSNAKITAQSPIVTEINVAGQSITLLDGGPTYKPNASISFYYNCESEDEFNRVWNAFTKEGTIFIAAAKYPWSEKYGWVSDKFGVSWQVGIMKQGQVLEKIIPCFMFTGDQYGNAEKAIAHYTTIFENAKVDSIQRYGSNELPDAEGKIKHAEILINNQRFMLLESAQSHGVEFSEGISFTIQCETQQQIDYYWEKLTESGEESMCGWLKDKFGVSWQIIPTILGKLMSDPAKAGKAAQAFMSMRKLNIEQIVQASIS